MTKSGLRSLSSCWEEWADVTSPQLTREIFTGIDGFPVQALSRWISQPCSRPFVITADSVAEALAALSCAVLHAPLCDEGISNRVLVVSSTDELESLMSSDAVVIPVFIFFGGGVEIFDRYFGRHIILISHPNSRFDSPDVKIDPLTADNFFQTLTEMGFRPDEIQSYAHKSGRSRTVLRRLLSHIPAIAEPAWAHDQERLNVLIPAALVGSWNTSLSTDRIAITRLCDAPPEVVEASFETYLEHENSPFRGQDRLRIVTFKTDFFHAVSEKVTLDHIHRFFLTARDVLFFYGPQAEPVNHENLNKFVDKRLFRSFGLLNNGVLETLCLLKLKGNTLFGDRLGVDIAQHVDELIMELISPVEAVDWCNEDEILPRLAEAAPDLFLSVLMNDLTSGSSVICDKLSNSKPRVIYYSERHKNEFTDLIGALQVMAWSPDRFPIVIQILSHIWNGVSLHGWRDRVKDSCVSLFKYWLPQTAASLTTRLQALDALVERAPELARQVSLKQLGRRGRGASLNRRPLWLEDAADCGGMISTSPEHLNETQDRALKIAIDWPHHDYNTLGDLVDCMPITPEADADIWQAIVVWCADSTTTSRAKYTLRLRVLHSYVTQANDRQEFLPGHIEALEALKKNFEL